MRTTIGSEQRHIRDRREASPIRLDTLALLVMLVAGCCVASYAFAAPQAGQVPRVGVLIAVSAPTTQVFYALFRQGLGALGYVEGEHIALEYRSAEGHYERLPALAAELVGLPVDVLVTWGTPAAVAAKQATSTIPIIFTAVADPLLSGLVRSFAQPGGNMTGVTHIPSELDRKRLELLKEALPSASHVGVLWHPEFPPNVESLPELKTAAQALGVTLHLAEYRGANDFEEAVATLRRDGAEVLFVMPSPTTSGHAARLAAFATQHQLPAMAPYRDFAEAGGLMAYGGLFADMYRRVPALVDKFLKGAKPSDVPVERPTRFELVINLKTAKALGLAVPPTLLLLADEVIQ